MTTSFFNIIPGLADIMKRLLIKYDNLFEVSFPYSMGWHGKLQDTFVVSIFLNSARGEKVAQW